jgi:hypothetical protein
MALAHHVGQVVIGHDTAAPGRLQGGTEQQQQQLAGGAHTRGFRRKIDAVAHYYSS